MKKINIIVCIFLFFILPAEAQEFRLDGIYYNFRENSDDEVEVTYPIEYRHDEWTAEDDYDGVIEIPERIVYGGKIYRVTAIGEQAFRESGAEVVKIPQSIEYIGWSAFRDCWSMREIEVGRKIPLDLREIERQHFPTHPNPYYSHTGEDIFELSEREFRQIVLVVPKGSKPLYENAEVWNRFPKIEEKKFTVQRFSMFDGNFEIEFITDGLRWPPFIELSFYDSGLGAFHNTFTYEPKELDSEQEAVEGYLEIIITDFFEAVSEGMGHKMWDAFRTQGGIQSFWMILDQWIISESI